MQTLEPKIEVKKEDDKSQLTNRLADAIRNRRIQLEKKPQKRKNSSDSNSNSDSD